MITVFFEGAGLTGKRSSVAAVAEQFGSSPESDGSVRLASEIGGRAFDFELVPSTWRTSRLDDNPEKFEMRRLDAAKQVAQATAIAFVVDSQALRMEANDGAFERLRESLEAHGRSFESTPILVLLNKRDLPGITPAADLKQRFSGPSCAHLETVACSGAGLERFLPTVVELLDRKGPSG